jgi:hypothetical protein
LWRYKTLGILSGSLRLQVAVDEALLVDLPEHRGQLPAASEDLLARHTASHGFKSGTRFSNVSPSTFSIARKSLPIRLRKRPAFKRYTR